MTDVLSKMLDTTTNAKALEYKAALLQPDNMVLIRSAAVTDISFYIHPQKPFSNELKAALIQKPVATVEELEEKLGKWGTDLWQKSQGLHFGEVHPYHVLESNLRSIAKSKYN